MAEVKDSLISEGGVSMNLDGTEMEYTNKVQDIKFTPRSIPENWDDLYTMVQVNPDLTDEAVFSFNKIFEEYEDLDKRERALAGQPYYKYMRDSLYPRLRTVKFNFFLHRKGMVKDTVHTTVLDTTYMNGVQALRDMDYPTALALLQPYEDYNTAVAYMGMDRNLSALQILEKMEKTSQVNYLLAIIYSRTGDPQKAVQCYMACCKEDRSYVHRGNLDLYGGKENTVILDHYAEVLYALGEYDVAFIYWNMALQKNDGRVPDLAEKINARKKEAGR